MGRIEEALGFRGGQANCKAHARRIWPGGMNYRNLVHPVLSIRAGSNSTLRVHSREIQSR